MTTVGHIINLARTDMIDEDDDNLSDSKMIDRFNLTTKNIITLVPKANSVSRSVQQDSGVKQIIPSDAISLINIECNMGTTPGTTRGEPVTEVLQETMKTVYSTYYSDTASATTEHFMRIPQSDNEYEIYPQSDGTGFLLMHLVIVPTDVVYDVGGNWESQAVQLDEKYDNPYVVGIKELVYDIDTDIPGNIQREQLNQTKLFASLQAIGAT
jgi:hypothetical protein